VLWKLLCSFIDFCSKQKKVVTAVYWSRGVAGGYITYTQEQVQATRWTSVPIVQMKNKHERQRKSIQ